ncbi:hypothetical protein [Arthrobacter sp. 8AJ]|nr:hypothetical protein [Arthrobacter sp. 8AJ]VXB82117.1 hypothetical protein ARTHRO8AJ_380057 [Arthrobacter sp. 8AJ]
MVHHRGRTRQFRENIVGQLREFVDHELTLLGLGVMEMRNTFTFNS